MPTNNDPEPPRVVFCFDRDLTVSTNPPDDSMAVPLSWVKYLAHERTDCDVWATGNQHLKKEAAIPGVAEARDVWCAQWETDRSVYKSEAPNGETYKPSRVEGLRQIKEIYDHEFPDAAITFVVIDDIDLSDLDGYDYYYPETFVYSVVSGKIFGFLGSVPVSDTPVNNDRCLEGYELSLQSLDHVELDAE